MSVVIEFRILTHEEQPKNTRYRSTLWWGNFNWGKAWVNALYVISISLFSTMYWWIPRHGSQRKEWVGYHSWKDDPEKTVKVLHLRYGPYDLYGQRCIDIDRVFFPPMKQTSRQAPRTCNSICRRLDVIGGDVLKGKPYGNCYDTSEGQKDSKDHSAT